jgi:hypothetical protein
LVVIVIVVILFPIVVILAPTRMILRTRAATTAPTHKGDQLGDEIVNVKRACARFHRARFGGVHVGRGDQKGRIERRFLWRRYWEERGEKDGRSEHIQWMREREGDFGRVVDKSTLVKE